MEPYDLAVIGGGPGGYVAAIRAGQLGLRTVCIDKRNTLGGTCLNVGCIPSKALLHATQQYADWRHALDNWVTCSHLQVDLTRLMLQKEQIVKGLVDGVASLIKKYKVDWIVGEAHLASPHKVRIGDSIIQAKNIILATGSSSIPLPFLPFDEKRVVSSTGALELKEIPKRLLVVGAGVIGVELASVYQRLGSEVTIVEMLEQICPAMDAAVSKALLQILKKQGITFHLGVKVTAGSVNNKEVSLTVQGQKMVADIALVSIGRRPYSEGLGLAELGIQTTAKGFVQVDGSFRTSQPHIYAIGDLIDGVMLAHRASEEGAAVAELIAGHRPRVNYVAIPNVIYTHPEVAAVGLTEAEAKDAGLQIVVGTFPMRANSRARCTGELDGLVKVIGEKATGRLLGMHIIASQASEMIGEGVIAMDRKATLQQIANASHAHPTLSEAIKEACLAALGSPIHL